MIDDEGALEDAMGSLSVRDDLNGRDQEAALKDLLSEVGDLGEVDTDVVGGRRPSSHTPAN